VGTFELGCSFFFAKNDMIDSMLLNHIVIAFLVTKLKDCDSVMVSEIKFYKM
jgi:hypothetical protein